MVAVAYAIFDTPAIHGTPVKDARSRACNITRDPRFIGRQRRALDDEHGVTLKSHS
jgi:hypothetical protein